MPSLSQIDLTRPPIVRQSSRDSITQGPAMMKNLSLVIGYLSLVKDSPRQVTRDK
jgi:hypothetical protein